MDYDVERTLRPELGPGEKLLWSGQPRGGLRLRGTDAMMIPFSLLWGGFAVFWELSVVRTNAPFFFRLWGVPFVLVGLYIVVGRFFADAYLRSRTMYGLTNQRVIIVAGFTGRQTKSLPLRTLNDLSLNERDDRSGTITFGTALSPYAWMELRVAGHGAIPAAGLRDDRQRPVRVRTDPQRTGRAVEYRLTFSRLPDGHHERD